jgi:hypothetical protein
MTNKELRTYLEHGIGTRRIKIKRDGSIVAYGSTRDTDRSLDFWQWIGFRDDIERQASKERRYNAIYSERTQ